MKLIKLKKKIYSDKETKATIDNSFSELSKSRDPINVDRLFKMYNELFFDVEKEGDNSHVTFIERSTEYVRNYVDPKDEQIDSLIERIEDLEEELAETIDQEHPFFPDGTMLYNGSALCLMKDGVRRHMQWTVSDPLRKILGFIDENHEPLPRMKCVTTIEPETMSGIPMGPRINNEQDLNNYDYKALTKTQDFYQIRTSLDALELNEAQHIQLTQILEEKLKIGQIQPRPQII